MLKREVPVYIDVTAPDQLAELFPLSNDAPVVLFLYDPYCPINWTARDELDEVDATIYRVDVAESRALGAAVQMYTKVRHESPQVIILRNQEAAWHASHGRIRAESVAEALASAS